MRTEPIDYNFELMWLVLTMYPRLCSQSESTLLTPSHALLIKFLHQELIFINYKSEPILSDVDQDRLKDLLVIGMEYPFLLDYFIILMRYSLEDRHINKTDFFSRFLSHYCDTLEKYRYNYSDLIILFEYFIQNHLMTNDNPSGALSLMQSDHFEGLYKFVGYVNTFFPESAVRVIAMGSGFAMSDRKLYGRFFQLLTILKPYSFLLNMCLDKLSQLESREDKRSFMISLKKKLLLAGDNLREGMFIVEVFVRYNNPDFIIVIDDILTYCLNSSTLGLLTSIYNALKKQHHLTDEMMKALNAIFLEVVHNGSSLKYFEDLLQDFLKEVQNFVFTYYPELQELLLLNRNNVNIAFESGISLGALIKAGVEGTKGFLPFFDDHSMSHVFNALTSDITPPHLFLPHLRSLSVFRGMIVDIGMVFNKEFLAKITYKFFMDIRMRCDNSGSEVEMQIDAALHAVMVDIRLVQTALHHSELQIMQQLKKRRATFIEELENLQCNPVDHLENEEVDFLDLYEVNSRNQICLFYIYAEIISEIISYKTSVTIDLANHRIADILSNIVIVLLKKNRNPLSNTVIDNLLIHFCFNEVSSEGDLEKALSDYLDSLQNNSTQVAFFSSFRKPLAEIMRYNPSLLLTTP